MTNDDLSRISMLLAEGRTAPLPIEDARMLLDQLRRNAAGAVRVDKELSDCERNLKQAIADLGALERIRKHPALANVVELLKMDRDDSACVNDSKVELFDVLIALLESKP